MNMINLISDTVTKPSEAMLSAMMKAEVGDDVFREDPTVNKLEGFIADVFGKESALFCPSGTMTNQLAIKVNTDPLDEIICDVDSHIYQYETGGYAFNSGVVINPIQGIHGKLTSEQVVENIKSIYDWLPRTRLVSLENSCNRGGGNFYTLEEMRSLSITSREHGLRTHLDGARLFNVLVETQDNTQEIGPLFDTISLCMSKGLGAPVGSLLLGSQKDITLARRYRKVMGGGMRQAGYLAAACQYALENNIDRLKQDNDRAKELAKTLECLNYVSGIRPVKTNILIFDLTDTYTGLQFLDLLKREQINVSLFGPQTVRFVTHLDITKEDIDRVKGVLSKLDEH